MPSPSLDIDQTISAIIRRRPVLEPVLKSFAPLLKARDEAASGLVPVLGASSVRLPKFDRQKARAGIPLLADFPGRGLGEAIRMAAEKLLPLFAEQAALLPHLAALEKFFLAAAEDDREALLEAMLVGSAESQAKIAEKNGLPPAVLNYVAEFVISAVLRALAAATDEANPWDEEAAWRQGYCPVCGSFPSIAWLDRPKADEKNAFLAGGGGKKHYHCQLCGSNWAFRRSACPACEKEGSETMEILRETDSHGERIDWCAHCRTYCPTIDLREVFDTPNMDAMAPGMMHLDIVASRNRLQPLKYSFWNMF